MKVRNSSSFCRLTTMMMLLLVMVSIIHIQVVAGQMPDDAGDGADFANMLNQPQPCANFRCSKGFSPVPKKNFKLESTGCSGMSSGMMVSAPGLGGNDQPFESCCHEWHACYQTCSSPKLVCDEAFSKCGDIKCKQNGDDEECKRAVSLQKMMMNINGCRAYDEQQNKACECIESNGVTQRRELAIRTFYESYVPEVEDATKKAKELAQKVDSAIKLAGLFRKLVKKYPNSIRHVENPQQGKYDKMMRDAQKTSAAKEKENDDTVVEDASPDDADERIEL